MDVSLQTFFRTAWENKAYENAVTFVLAIDKQNLAPLDMMTILFTFLLVNYKKTNSNITKKSSLLIFKLALVKKTE